MQINEAITLWKELGITECIMEFSCGGDSMNDYNFKFYKPNDKKGKNQPAVIEVDSKELTDYFENAVFKEVNFYEASDGHYQGEHGEVNITLSDDEDEPEFNYSKNAQSEWSESVDDDVYVKLTKNEKELLEKFVTNINGGDGETIFNYKIDFIMTDEIDDTFGKLKEKIYDQCAEHEIENAEGEEEDWFTFTTDGDTIASNDLEFVGNTLKVTLTKRYIVYSDSTD